VQELSAEGNESATLVEIFGKRDGKNGVVIAHALVDVDDFDLVNGWRWNLTSKGYAATSGTGKITRMHRMILNPQPDQSIDHINRNKLVQRQAIISG
jgi:hypothetical protein